MPFRIHKYNSCLAIGESIHENNMYSLHNTKCVNKEVVDNYMNVTYEFDQLFYFFPLINTTQQLQMHKGTGMQCLTVGEIKNNGDISVAGEKRVVYVDRCIIEANAWTPVNGPSSIRDINLFSKENSKEHEEAVHKILSQQFLIKIFKELPHIPGQNMNQYTAQHALQHLNNRYIVPQAVLPMIVALSIAQITNLDDITDLEQWYHNHKHSKSQTSTLLCMAIYPEAQDEVLMEPCNPLSHHQKFIIERTTSAAWIKFIRLQLENGNHGHQDSS